jgi:hypothetical protein
MIREFARHLDGTRRGRADEIDGARQFRIDEVHDGTDFVSVTDPRPPLLTGTDARASEERRRESKRSECAAVTQHESGAQEHRSTTSFRRVGLPRLDDVREESGASRARLGQTLVTGRPSGLTLPS